ncbi:hypothetical protein SAMN05444483_11710 [Salegentibacter echinorum]|uniref:Uncharacterized protein n=1 Tax=Salegentibacter echinorum TaxID=1073325 RepID=A0A1M5KZB3_SALEC|nr:hypothetical protein SAMN05444483_11710 [Salegentibacter echinorum]
MLISKKVNARLLKNVYLRYFYTLVSIIKNATGLPEFNLFFS